MSMSELSSFFLRPRGYTWSPRSKAPSREGPWGHIHAFLPIEVVELILVYAAAIHHPAMLRRCMLVCRAWLPTVRTHLWRTIYLPPNVKSSHRPLSPITISYVRELAFVGWCLGNGRDTDSTLCTRPFEKLESLKVLRFTGSRLFGYASLATLIAAFPGIDTLDMEANVLPYGCERLELPGATGIKHLRMSVSLNFGGDNQMAAAPRISEALAESLETIEMEFVPYKPESVAWITSFFFMKYSDLSQYPKLQTLILPSALRVENNEPLPLPMDLLDVLQQNMHSDTLKEIRLGVDVLPLYASPTASELTQWTELDCALTSGQLPALERVRFDIQFVDGEGGVKCMEEMCGMVDALFPRCRAKGLLRISGP